MNTEQSGWALPAPVVSPAHEAEPRAAEFPVWVYAAVGVAQGLAYQFMHDLMQDCSDGPRPWSALVVYFVVAAPLAWHLSYGCRQSRALRLTMATLLGGLFAFAGALMGLPLDIAADWSHFLPLGNMLAFSVIGAVAVPLWGMLDTRNIRLDFNLTVGLFGRNLVLLPVTMALNGLIFLLLFGVLWTALITWVALLGAVGVNAEWMDLLKTLVMLPYPFLKDGPLHATLFFGLFGVSLAFAFDEVEILEAKGFMKLFGQWCLLMVLGLFFSYGAALVTQGFGQRVLCTMLGCNDDPQPPRPRSVTATLADFRSNNWLCTDR